MNPSLVPLLCGALLEAVNAWIYLRTDRSGLPLIPIVAIGAGVFTYPGLSTAMQGGAMALAVVVHFGLPFVCRPGLWAKLRGG